MKSKIFKKFYKLLKFNENFQKILPSIIFSIICAFIFIKLENTRNILNSKIFRSKHNSTGRTETVTGRAGPKIRPMRK